MAEYNLGNGWRSPPRSLNLTFQIKDFGPITKADITIKPCTILIGPNSSGKSHIAMLAHALISSHNKMKVYLYSNNKPTYPFRKMLMSTRGGATLKKKKEFDIPTAIMDDLRKEYVKILFKDVFVEELRSCFAVNYNQLARFGSGHFAIKFSRSNSYSIAYQGDSFSLNIVSRKVRLSFQHGMPTSFSESIDEHGDATYDIEVDTGMPHLDEFVWDETVNVLDVHTSDNIPLASHYFPSARSGLLHAFPTVVANMIKNIRWSSTTRERALHIPSTIVDFVSNMAYIHADKGQYVEIGKELEEKMFGGHITLSNPKVGVPKIGFEYKKYKVPLHRVSSSISEIAPLTLFLKHIVRAGDLLIIEEPEAHLHPANQLILARYIVKMIRAGINIMITTHSIHILEQLSNFLQASKINKNAKAKLKFDDDEYLLEDEIAPYLHVGSAAEGYKVLPIECSQREGISQEEFVKIEDELTRQTWHIENGMPEEK